MTWFKVAVSLAAKKTSQSLLPKIAYNNCEMTYYLQMNTNKKKELGWGKKERKKKLFETALL